MTDIVFPGGVDRLAATAATTAGSQLKTALDSGYAPSMDALSAADFGYSASGSAAGNRTSLQQAVDAAISQKKDLLLPGVSPLGAYPQVAGTVNVTGPVRIFGRGGKQTRIHQTVKPSPIFYVTGEDAKFYDLYFTGDGLNMTGTAGPWNFQNYDAILARPYAHGLEIRRCSGKDIYTIVLIRQDPALTGPPPRIERFVADDIWFDGWCAIHGGPFLNGVINNIRGTYRKAYSTDGIDTGQKPHLVYTNTADNIASAAGGIWADDWRSHGISITNITAWNAPDTGSVVALKYADGVTGGNITGTNCPGGAELYALQDSKLVGVTSLLDKYPLTGEESSRAGISYAYCKRVTLDTILVSHAAMDHGKALMFESTSEDCVASNVQVVSRKATAETSDTGATNIAIAGNRNTVLNPVVFNLGQQIHSAVRVVGTGAYGRVVNPKVSGPYVGSVRVESNHLGGIIDYEPMSCRSAAISRQAGAQVLVRDRSAGQVVQPGFIDLFERPDATALVLSDDGKPWSIMDTSTNQSRFGITSGVAYYIGGAPRSLAVADGISANGTLKVTLGPIASAQGGMVARVQDANNYIGVDYRVDAASIRPRLVKRVGGTATTIASAAAGVTLTTGSVLELIMNGTSVSLKLDGTEIIAAQTVSDFSTLTKHGLRGDSNDLTIGLAADIRFTPA